MVKSRAEPAPNTSTTNAYDFTAVSSALGQVDESLATSSTAFNMTGLSEALGKPDHLERIVLLARVHEKMHNFMGRPHAARITPFKVQLNLERRRHLNNLQGRRKPVRMDCEELDRTFKSLMNDQKLQD